jgi:hypothetical protein
MLRASLSHEETVAHQIDRRGFKREDVRDIIITHLDLDHACGLSDFPAARVHVTAAEALGAIRSPSWRERIRYRSAQWAHNPNIVEHDPQGEKWRGFAAAKGTCGDITGHCARFASRSHSRPCLCGRRCRPSLGTARRRCVLSLRHPRRDTRAASVDGDGVPLRIRAERRYRPIMLDLSSCTSAKTLTC